MSLAAGTGLQGLRETETAGIAVTQSRQSSHGLRLPFRVRPRCERPPYQRDRSHARVTEVTLDGASLEVCAPTAFPRAAAAAFSAPGLPRPRRLTPSGFLNLLTLHSCRACRPYFRPDPLLGFSLQSFAPHPQPYAVSGACTLMSLNAPNTTRTPHPSLRPKPKLDSDGHAASHPLPCAEAPGCGSAASSAPPESRRSDLVEERA
jgi:hypothetical protein